MEFCESLLGDVDIDVSVWFKTIFGTTNHCGSFPFFFFFGLFRAGGMHVVCLFVGAWIPDTDLKRNETKRNTQWNSTVPIDLIIDPSHPNYGPIFITVTEKPAIRLYESPDPDEDRLKRRERGRRRPAKPTNKQLTEPKGSIGHRVVEDGDINVCIKASAAISTNPIRVGVRIEEEEEVKGAKEKKDPSLGADYHFSFMEQEFDRIEASMHNILGEADFAKERDSIFHKNTDAMLAATVFWPVLQVCILLATGFTQANNIVNFFKKRRII